MSNNMGKLTNNDEWLGHGERATGGGMIIAKTCVICNEIHNARPKEECSQGRQKYYAHLEAIIEDMERANELTD
jgi:hypothetical protein